MVRRLLLAGKPTDFWDYRESFHQVYYTEADLANRPTVGGLTRMRQ